MAQASADKVEPVDRTEPGDEQRPHIRSSATPQRPAAIAGAPWRSIVYGDVLRSLRGAELKGWMKSPPKPGLKRCARGYPEGRGYGDKTGSRG